MTGGVIIALIICGTIIAVALIIALQPVVADAVHEWIRAVKESGKDGRP